MKKQYEMPNLYVVAFTGEVDTAGCSEPSITFPQGASTFGMKECPDPGPVTDPGTTDPGDGDFGPIH